MGKKVEEYAQSITHIKVTTDTSMTSVMDTMLKSKSPFVVVTDANKELQGIITGSDIIREIERSGDSSALLTGTAGYVMTRQVASLPVGRLMLDAAEEMFRRRLRVLVITQQYEPIGVLTQLDIIRWWIDEKNQQFGNMRV